MPFMLNSLLKEFRQMLEEIYGNRLVKLVLFGSQARKDAEVDSDIDILVILKGPISPGKEIARISSIKAELSLKYNTVISCVFISEERYLHEQSPLLLNIHREGVLV